MKKIVVFVIALTMGIALLTGCGTSGNKDRLNKTASAASETVKTTVTGQDAGQGAKTPDNKYVIYVQDAETEEPIPGVRVKFCSDSMCMMGKTDEKGCALFDQDPGEYTAHILKAPEGYEKNEEEIVLTADEHIATFKLNKIK